MIIFLYYYLETVTDQPYLYLSLDLPTAPLFKDDFDKNFIPQVMNNLQKKK